MIKITEKDIGRKVLLRDGTMAYIEKYRPRTEFPILTSDHRSYTTSGSFLAYEANDADIIAFAEEPTTDKEPATDEKTIGGMRIQEFEGDAPRPTVYGESVAKHVIDMEAYRALVLDTIHNTIKSPYKQNLVQRLVRKLAEELG